MHTTIHSLFISWEMCLAPGDVHAAVVSVHWAVCTDLCRSPGPAGCLYGVPVPWKISKFPKGFLWHQYVKALRLPGRCSGSLADVQVSTRCVSGSLEDVRICWRCGDSPEDILAPWILGRYSSSLEGVQVPRKMFRLPERCSGSLANV